MEDPHSDSSDSNSELESDEISGSESKSSFELTDPEVEIPNVRRQRFNRSDLSLCMAEQIHNNYPIIIFADTIFHTYYFIICLYKYNKYDCQNKGTSFSKVTSKSMVQ